MNISSAFCLSVALMLPILSANEQPIKTYEQFQEKVTAMAGQLLPEAEIQIASKLLNKKRETLPRSVYFNHATHYYIASKGKAKKYRNITLRLTYSDGARILAGHRHPDIKKSLGKDELQALQTAQNLIATHTHPDMTRLEKVLFLHDALAKHGAYDYSDISNQSCVSMLVRGVGACGAYARSMHLLLSMLDIPHHVIQGENVAGGPHCWGLVQLDDENWYHLDVTKDDNPTTPYLYFCVTDTDMAQEHIWPQKHYPATPNGIQINIPQFQTMEELRDAALLAYHSGAVSYCARLSTDNDESAAFPQSEEMKIYKVITSPSRGGKFIFLSFRDTTPPANKNTDEP